MIEDTLLKILRASLKGEVVEKIPILSEDEWNRLVAVARQHAVLPLLYGVFAEWELGKSGTHSLSVAVWRSVDLAARRTVLQSRHLHALTHQVQTVLEEAGIHTAVLKGVVAAVAYPEPELRKSGDVDLLLQDAGNLPAAQQLLQTHGFSVRGEQHGAHHLAMVNEDGIEVELHTLLSEPLEGWIPEEMVVLLTRRAAGHFVQREIMGQEFTVLEEPYHALQLLLHMLQHFLHAGFGLKLLCDWVCLWNRYSFTDTDVAEKWDSDVKQTEGIAEQLPDAAVCKSSDAQIYLELIDQAGLTRFSDLVTSVCVRKLGLSSDAPLCGVLFPEEDCERFMQDVLAGGEFGTAQAGRMVVMAHTGPFGLVREFHRQMHGNFPKAGRVFLCWPVLWVMTLCRFLNNNRKVRGTGTARILRESRARSELVSKLRLFQ